MLDVFPRPAAGIEALGDRLGDSFSSRQFNVVDFTFSAYERLLDAALDAGYEFLTVADYLAADRLPERFVVLRHDVDRRAAKSRAMAELERDRGVSATYYVREHLLDPGSP